MKNFTTALLAGALLVSSGTAISKSSKNHQPGGEDPQEVGRDNFQRKAPWKIRQELPPGLQKKYQRTGQLPPGWQDKLQVGQILDLDIYRAGEVVGPVDRNGQISIRLPERTVRIIAATRKIVDIFFGN